MSGVALTLQYVPTGQPMIQSDGEGVGIGVGAGEGAGVGDGLGLGVGTATHEDHPLAPAVYLPVVHGSRDIAPEDAAK